MNKTELINSVAEKAGLKKTEAKAAIDAAIISIAETLQQQGKVSLIGFGTFSVTTKAARTGINPKTKAKIEIPARKAVKFKAGSDLTDIIK